MSAMNNDPTDPNYDSADSTNKPIDRDEDQMAQDTGAQVGYGEEANEEGPGDKDVNDDQLEQNR